MRKSATNLRDCNIIRFKIGPFKENETWTWKSAAGEGTGGEQLASVGKQLASGCKVRRKVHPQGNLLALHLGEFSLQDLWAN